MRIRVSPLALLSGGLPEDFIKIFRSKGSRSVTDTIRTHTRTEGDGMTNKVRTFPVCVVRCIRYVSTALKDIKINHFTRLNNIDKNKLLKGIYKITTATPPRP